MHGVWCCSCKPISARHTNVLCRCLVSSVPGSARVIMIDRLGTAGYEIVGSRVGLILAPDRMSMFFLYHNLAAEYDTKFKAVLGNLESQVKASADFIGVRQGDRLLDYASQSLVSKSLGDHLSQCVGVDISESMVAVYNSKAKDKIANWSKGFTPEERIAHVGSLIDESDATCSGFPNLTSFDLAGVGLSFHHFDDCHLAARRLIERLRPDGGIFFILDLVSHATSAEHCAAKGVKHQGFSESQVREMFEDAGAGKNFRFMIADEEVAFDHADGEGGNKARQVFFARGERV
ncbi:hypothetical protein RJ55_04523 [Drechmeria coniospora]|nr:hypothetical protein RJ55_04523 [Drechmeria coniospora]